MEKTSWNLMRVPLLCAALTCQLSFAQQWTFTLHQVQGQLYMLEPANTNGNVGVMVGDDGVLLVDSHFQPAVQLLEEVAALTDEDVKFLVNTHIHPDHIGGNSLLRTTASPSSPMIWCVFRCSRNSVSSPRGTFIKLILVLTVLTYTDASAFISTERRLRFMPSCSPGEQFCLLHGVRCSASW